MRVETAMADAFQDAGYKTEADRLRGIVAAAWARYPDSQTANKRYDYTVQCIQREQLTWFLVEWKKPGMIKSMILDMLWGSRPDKGKRNGGGHISDETQHVVASSDKFRDADHGRRSVGAIQGLNPNLGMPPAATNTTPYWKAERDRLLAAQASGSGDHVHHKTPSRAPGSAQPHDNYRGAFAVWENMSRLDLFEVNGVLVKFMTKAQVDAAQTRLVGECNKQEADARIGRKKAAILAKISLGMSSPTETVEQAWRNKKQQIDEILANTEAEE